MEILVNGQKHTMQGYIPLDAQMDAAFADLLASFFSDPEHSFDDLSRTYLPRFDPSAFEFLDRHMDNTLLQDGFFTNLTFIWRVYLDSRRLSEAQAFWEVILHSTRTWEQDRKSRIHKGSPLYFWAVTAILQGEVDKGFFLMHSAYQEDVETQNSEFPPTPAFRFVTLDFDNVEQFFYSYVRDLADYLDQFLNPYRATCPGALRMSELRDLFLARPPSKHVIFSFTHTLARLRGLSTIPSYALQSNFAGQYELNVLFDLALIIDESIKEKDPDTTHWRFIEFAEFLSDRGGLDLARDDLGYANAQMRQIFEATLRDLLDGTFAFEDGATRTRIECDIAIAHCLRNYAAHNIASFPSVWREFEAIRQSLLNVLFFCVDILYR